MGEAVTGVGPSPADLVQVAYANDRVEGELIRGLLDSGGIPSLLEPILVNGPEMGIASLPQGPQRVMARVGQAEAARRLLADALAEGREAEPEAANARYLDDARGRKPRSYGLIGAYARIYLWSFCVFAVAFGIFWLLREWG
jgi:hypothetical protein